MECSNGRNVMTGRDTILIVDDMEINRVILRGVFEADYNLLEAENGQQALVFLEHDMEASEIIMKPCEPYVVKRRVQNIIELNQHRLNQEELIEEQAARLRESNSAMIDALSSIIEYRSAETEQHIRRTMEIFKPVLNVWTEADASLIRLGEKDACMLSCHDITRYK